jgi:hypothetical protein
MAIVTLYCEDTPQLKLGPGQPPDLWFVDGFCSFNPENFPDWQAWAFHPGTPKILVLPEGETAPTGNLAPCPICSKAVATSQLNRHILGHKPKSIASSPAQEGIQS